MESAKRIVWINMPGSSEVETHGSRDQAWLSKVSEITAGALPRDASGTERRPVMDVRHVAGRDTPGRCFSEESCRVPHTQIENIILGVYALLTSSIGRRPTCCQ